MTSRILTLQPKSLHAAWTRRAEVLSGWNDYVEQFHNRPKRRSVRDDVVWAWRLFRESRKFPAVATGSERAAHIFALLQAFFRSRPVPHVFIDWMWNPSGSSWRDALKRFQFQVELGSHTRVIVYSRRNAADYTAGRYLPESRVRVVYYHTTVYLSPPPCSDGDYIFAGGDSRRDYGPLVAAARDIPRRVVIAALDHSRFRGLAIPGNVEIVRTTVEGFLELLAGAFAVVVPMRGGAVRTGGHQTYLNAMALGKPVVVADDGGANEYITSGQDGFVVRPGDESGMREALLELVGDPERARQIGERARLTASKYSPEHFFEGVFEVVDEVVSGCSRK